MKISIRITLSILIFALMPMLVEAGHPGRHSNQNCLHNGNKPVCETNTTLLTVFGPRTFVRNSAKPKLETVTFQIPHPKGGAAILEILTKDLRGNGLLASKEIFLNGRNLVDRQDLKTYKDNKIEIPVFLRSGNNSLGVELRGKPGDKLTIEIKAPVDHIDLKPINEPLIIGIDKLSAEASLTGLGIAASGVTIDFSVEGLGTIERIYAITDVHGKATAQFLDFPVLGEGVLNARVRQAKPLLATSTPLTVVGAPRIGIQQTRTQIDVKEGQQATFSTTIDFTPGIGDTRAYEILTEQVITPNNGGIAVTPIGSWTTAQSMSKTTPVALSGLTSGTYIVTTTAKVVKVGATSEDQPLASLSTALTVGVFNSNVDQPLFLGAPTGNPSAIPLGANQQVVFSTRVTGTGHPPEVLTLWEVNTQGQRTAIGNLLDNQENGDLVKGDGFYSGTFPVNANVEGEKRYLVAASYQGMTVESPLHSLIITSLPIGPAPLDETNAVRDPDTGQQFAAGEILVKFKPGTPKLEINNALAQQRSTIIGSLPEIGVLEVTIPGIDPIDVRRAVATFQNLPQVEFAEPNVLLATGGALPDRPCPTASDFDCDWAAIQVRAPEVWDPLVPASEGDGVGVAVVDDGVDATDPDLYGIVQPGADGTAIHGTYVARMVGAKRGNGGITGIAPKANVVAYPPQGDWKNKYSSQLSQAISHLDSGQIKVVNLSIWEECMYSDNGTECMGLMSSDPPVPLLNLKTAIQVTNNILFVTIAGNHNTQDKPTLVDSVHAKQGLVVGATNFDGKRADQNTPASGQNSGWRITNQGSGYGSWVDIAAPGENVCVGVDASNHCILGTGTSFAAPQVSGAAALLFAQIPNNITDPVSYVKQKLIAYSKPLIGENGEFIFCPGTNANILGAQCAGLLDAVSPIASQSINVAAGFKIRVVASGLPVGTEDAVQDIASIQDINFGNYLYFIRNQNEIWRVDALGGIPELFSTITAASVGANIPTPRLTVLSFGFDGDLFAVDGNTNPGRVYRIFSDKTKPPILFSEGVATASEGIAYSPGGIFGNKIFLSEFDNSPNRITAIDSSGNVGTPAFVQLSDSNRLTGLAFDPGGNFGSDLFGVDHDGTIFKVAANGTYTKFTANPPIGQNETLAFGSLDPNNPFGENLFVTPDGKGQIVKIDPNGVSSVFASGFAGFDYRGVTGLKFSPDKKTLFVTDDNAGIIYAITAQ